MKPGITITLELSVRGGKHLNFLELAYSRCVLEAGGMPLFFPSLPSPEFFEQVLDLIDGLVLTGGADIHPSFYREEITAPIRLSPDQRTEFDLQFFLAALKKDKTILAICHGMQIMNIALGGSLYQDLDLQRPGSLSHRAKEEDLPAIHRIQVEARSRLAGILGELREFKVCSTHHQAVKVLGKGLIVNASSPDGLIEGVELRDSPKVIGVQWHPEKDRTSEASKRLFRGFVALACH